MLRTFQNFLDEMGIPSAYADEHRSMIEFTIGDINYVFMYRAEEDPTYIRILLPNAGLVPEQSPETLREVYSLTNSFKLGKAFIQNGQMWFVTEAFIYDRENLTPLFQRMLSVLRDMLHTFRSNTNGR